MLLLSAACLLLGAILEQLRGDPYKLVRSGQGLAALCFVLAILVAAIYGIKP
jgi:hypothetical protein